MLEEKLKNVQNGTGLTDTAGAGNSAADYDAGSRASDAGGSASSAPEKKQKVVELSPAAFEDYQLLSKNWQNLVEAQTRLFRSVFRGTTVGAREDKLQILFKDAYYMSIASKTGQEAEVKKLLETAYGKKFDIEFAVLKENEAAPKVVGRRIPGIEMDIDEE